MKKKLLISLLTLILIAVACVAMVGCDNTDENKETRVYHVKFDYSITSQFIDDYSFTMGNLINKPENPTFVNNIFNAGYGITEKGYIGESEYPIKNPRLNDGYDANKNYRFIAWFTEPEYLYQWDFSEDRIWRNMTLYAKWIEY